MRDHWGFATAGQVYFGSGVHRQMGRVAHELGAEAALVVTDSK